MLSKSLTQFSVDGRGCVPFLLFDLRLNHGGGYKDNGDCLQKVPCRTTTLSAPDPAAGHRRPMSPPETPGHSGACLGQFVGLLLLLSPGSWRTQGSVCTLQDSVSPVLCKFWWLYGGVNGDLLQEGLCHTHVCGTQSPCPCGSLLLTCTSTGDTQTQFWLGLCGVFGAWCTQGFFESSKCLWWVWNFILNLISPLLLSCWGFSFALGHVVSFFGGIQHPPVDSCSAASCNFGFLTGEDEHISFYSTIFLHHLGKV